MISVTNLPNEIVEKIILDVINDSSDPGKSFFDLSLVNSQFNQICIKALKDKKIRPKTCYLDSNSIRFFNAIKLNLPIISAKLTLQDPVQLAEFMKHKKTLTSFSVKDLNDYFCEPKNMEFFKEFPLLKDLSIEFFSNIDFNDINIQHIAENLPNLESLKVKRLGQIYLECTEQCFEILSNLKLRKLAIINNAIAECPEVENVNFPDLKELNIGACGYISTDFFDILSKFPKLEKLIIDELETGGADGRDSWEKKDPFANFPKLNNLKELNIYRHEYVDLRKIRSSKNLFDLERLSISAVCKNYHENNIIKIKQIYNLFAKNFNKLKSLRLNFELYEYTREYNCLYIKELEQIPSLKELILGDSIFSHQNLLHLFQLNNISTMSFENVNFENEFTSEISTYKNTNIKTIKIDSNKEDTDSIFDIFLYVENLEHLILNGSYTNLDDFTCVEWNVISKLPTLKWITLNQGTTEERNYTFAEFGQRADEFINTYIESFFEEEKNYSNSMNMIPLEKNNLTKFAQKFLFVKERDENFRKFEEMEIDALEEYVKNFLIDKLSSESFDHIKFNKLLGKRNLFTQIYQPPRKKRVLDT